MAANTYLGIVGVGGVGTALLEQLSRIPNAPKLVLLSRSRKTLLAASPSHSPAIPFADWETSTAAPGVTVHDALQPDEIIKYLSSVPGRAILIDNTSDILLAKSYPSFLKRGISIVTPNKKAFSDELSLWNEIFDSAAQGNARVYHQATVGGSLPILSTLRDLITTGDEIVKIEGVLSGTLSLLFDTYMPAVGTANTKWSSLVAHALEIGFMEPDPRDDLNGMDFARKLTILARVVGIQVMGPESFPVDSLVPKSLLSLPSSTSGVIEFMAELPKYDAQMNLAKIEAEKSGKVLRYIGSIDVPTQTIRVGLQHLDRDNPIANLKGSQIVSIYTKRYGANPLVLKGGGGGGEVTAMCVMADLLKLLGRL
ncbi:hypothetical protein N7478_008889 [Penicillium angulare]|uniref:uncharacterized protein n=1 Tax=Penicillium angulare TaxID=116970 RepID=UPI0025412823|nr:uncharacterized protein N7478_008889 [Penicillium angulare]KAJ5273764.1 hypothetical protein N7478_008889 [Penicillium angulare]